MRLGPPPAPAGAAALARRAAHEAAHQLRRRIGAVAQVEGLSLTLALARTLSN